MLLFTRLPIQHKTSFPSSLLRSRSPNFNTNTHQLNQQPLAKHFPIPARPQLRDLKMTQKVVSIPNFNLILSSFCESLKFLKFHLLLINVLMLQRKSFPKDFAGSLQYLRVSSSFDVYCVMMSKRV